MIPHTPLLLVAAANAIARHAPRMWRERPRLTCSLEFVQSVGATTHVDLRVGATSWPLGFVTTLEMLRTVARQRALTREQVQPGDLLVFPWPRTLAPSWVTLPAGAGPRAPHGVVPDAPDERPPLAEAGGGATPGPSRAHVASGEEGVGIVLEVHDRRLATDGSIRRVLVATARAMGRDTMVVETLDYWCDTRRRDLAIRWYATADDIERAA